MLKPWNQYTSILFFTGAGLSAESGIPTYRGKGGIWEEYRFEDYACEEAFQNNPKKVLEFHEKRRTAVLECQPHHGHIAISEFQQQFPQTTIITQNIDGMHQRSGAERVLELHGSLWRMRCPNHGVSEDIGPTYQNKTCPKCGSWLRPDITWFGDALNEEVFYQAHQQVLKCDLFICIGTSGTVFPAAAFPQLAFEQQAEMVYINIEAPEYPEMWSHTLLEPASEALPKLLT